MPVIFLAASDIRNATLAATSSTSTRRFSALRDAILNLSGVKLSTTADFIMDPATRQAKREVCLLKMDGDKFTFVKYLPYPSYVPTPL